MATVRNQPATSTGGSSIADLLERILDKGVVIAGDVKVKLVDIELLTIQIRLVICSIDKAKEMGMDWWANSSIFNEGKTKAPEALPPAAAGGDAGQIDDLKARIAELEKLVEKAAGAQAPAPPSAPAWPQSPPWIKPIQGLPATPPMAS